MKNPPKPITSDIVERVSNRIAHGVSLKLALAAERNPLINESAWSATLNDDPQLALIPDAVKGEFCENAAERLVRSDQENLKWLCWLLERCYPEMFGASNKTTESAKSENAIPEEFLKLFREEAKRL